MDPCENKMSWKLKDHWSGFDYIPLITMRGSLYLGAWETDEEEVLLVEELRKRKIDLIIGLGFDAHPIHRFVHLTPVRTITAQIEDFSDSDKKMKTFLEANLEAIHIALLSGENVYVHCHAGISRSATVVAAYLIEYHEYSYEEAIEYIRRFRPQVHPNPGFCGLLEKWSSQAKN